MCSLAGVTGREVIIAKVTNHRPQAESQKPNN